MSTPSWRCYECRRTEGFGTRATGETYCLWCGFMRYDGDDYLIFTDPLQGLDYRQRAIQQARVIAASVIGETWTCGSSQGDAQARELLEAKIEAAILAEVSHWLPKDEP